MSSTPRTTANDPAPQRRPKVILCGPFPEPGGNIGGIARWDELVASSFLDERFGIHPLRITLPSHGGMARRLVDDLRRVRECLATVDAPLFHLTSQYVVGTYREYLQYRLARRAGRAFVFDIRGGPFIESYLDLRAPLRRRLLREMIEGAAAITVEGERYVGWMRETFGRDAVWIPNMVLKRHANEYPRASLDRPAAGEPIRVAYSGRFVPSKGLEALIAATARLEAAGTPIHLTLLGSGSPDYERALRACVKDHRATERVTFTGALDHAEVLEALATQHVFGFPTEWWGEGHSNAVNEAMQVGLPVITTRQGFMGDVITPETGIHIPDASPESVANAIAELAADWDRLRALGSAAHERVYGEFSDEVALARMAETWERVLEQSHRC